MMNRNFSIFSILLVIVFEFWAPQRAAAVDLYLDQNGATAGFGTAGGTWGTDSIWNLDNTGASVPGNTNTTTADDLHLGTAADGLGAGTVTIGGTSNGFGSLTLGSASGGVTISGGQLDLSNTDSTVTVDASAGLVIDSALAGSGGLVKDGDQELTLSGNNTYDGVTTINAGTVTVTHDNALGSTNGHTVVGATFNDRGVLHLDGSGGDLTIAEDLVMTGGNNGQIRNVAGENTITGLVTLNGTTDLRGNGVTFSGGITSTSNQSISFNGRYTVDTAPVTIGGGTVTITSNGNNPANATAFNVTGNDWNTARINFGGYLRLDQDNVLPSDGNVEFGWHQQNSSSGTLDLNGTNQTINSLSVTPFFPDMGGNQNVTGGGVLTIDQAVAGTREYQGRITDGATPTTLTKTGVGTQVLNNLSGTANNYTGVTTINGGVLGLEGTTQIDNSTEIAVGSSGTFDVTARTGGAYTYGNTLSGSGTIAGDLTMTGTISAGDSSGGDIGTLTFNNSLTADPSAVINLDLASPLANVSGFFGDARTDMQALADTDPVAQHDSLDVANVLTIDPGTTININLAGLTPQAGQVFDIFDFNSLAGLTNADVEGANDFLFTGGTAGPLVLPTLSGDLLWDTSQLVSSGQLAVVTAVPEPSSVAFFTLAATVLLRRRRRQ